MQGDVGSEDAEAKRAQAALQRHSKSLRPSLTRSPSAVKRSNSSTEKPGAAMVSNLRKWRCFDDDLGFSVAYRMADQSGCITLFGHGCMRLGRSLEIGFRACKLTVDLCY